MTIEVLADRIRRRLGELSPAERKVARVLLADFPDAGLTTVAVLAQRAQVSGPTVLRFAARLGFDGFPDFQSTLRDESAARSASPAALYDDRPAAGMSLTELVLRTPDVLGEATASTLRDFPRHDLDTAVSLLADTTRRITFAGGRFTRLLAHYLALHLTQMRPRVRLLPEHPVERAAMTTEFKRSDVLVLFDYRRYEPDSTTLAALVDDAGGKVIVFTDTWLSPAAAHADVVLPNRVDSLSPYDSLVPTLATVETVIAAVLGRLGDAAQERMRLTEGVNRS